MIAQVAALLIFVTMFILIVMDKIERHIITLACGALTLVLVFGISMHSMDAVLDTLNVYGIFKLDFWYQTGRTGESSGGINWATIFFIMGMMIMVEGMAMAGFFKWLCLRIAYLVKFKATPIFIAFMIMSFVLAMFIDSITVILFLAAVSIELAQLLKFDPVPMILAEIFTANLGGSATMCGDPPNIIIGTSLGYSFTDFITNTGLIAGISLIAVIFYFYFYFRKDLQKSAAKAAGIRKYPDPEAAITNKGAFDVSCAIFICAIILLVTHAQTGLTIAFIGVFIAGVVLIASGKEAVTIIRKIDYKTILFFIGLFIVVGGLEETGILEIIAAFIGKVSGGNTKLVIIITIWISAIASAFVDNIPFAATMIPVIKNLAITQNIELSVLAWALSMGTDIGGSATPIGASSNVVGTSVAAREGYLIGWRKYCKSALPATILVLIISTIIIFVRYL